MFNKLHSSFHLTLRIYESPKTRSSMIIQHDNTIHHQIPKSIPKSVLVPILEPSSDYWPRAAHNVAAVRPKATRDGCRAHVGLFPQGTRNLGCWRWSCGMKSRLGWQSHWGKFCWDGWYVGHLQSNYLLTSLDMLQQLCKNLGSRWVGRAVFL